MNRLTSLVACLLAGAAVTGPARGDDPPGKLTAEERKELAARWEELMVTGDRAYQAGKYPDAVKRLRDALEVARRLYPKGEFPDGHADLATSNNNLATLYQGLGNLADAEPLFKDALDMSRRLFKGDHADVASGMNNLAILYWHQNKLADAERLYKDALDMSRRLFKGDHPDVAATENNLANLYLAQGKPADAEPLLKDALEVRRRLFEGDHPLVAQSLTALAALYRQQAKYAAAEPLYKEALAMRRRAFKRDHPDVANSLTGLGLLYESQGNLAAAEPLLTDARDMLRRLFKGDHPLVAQSQNNLAYLYKAEGKYAAAEGLFRDALEMTRRLFKGDHPNVAMGLNNLAAAYLAEGMWTAAEPLFVQALEMRRRVFAGDHALVASTLDNLGMVYQDVGRHADAERLCREALEMNKRLFKGDHPELAQVLNNLGGLYESQGKFAAAEPVLREALGMRERLYKGKDHLDLAFSLHKLGALYVERGRYANAEPLLRDALEMRQRLFKGDHPALAENLISLSKLYRGREKFPEAERLSRDALAMCGRLFKGDHPARAVALNNLAYVYDVQGKWPDAGPLYADALAMTRRLYEGDHTVVARGLSNLAAVSWAGGKFADADARFVGALEMSRRLVGGYAKQMAEGEALTFAASQGLYRDAYLAFVRERKRLSPTPYDPATAYPTLWAAKGILAQAYEQRHLRSRAAAADPEAARALAALADARRRRAEVLLARATDDADTRDRRAAAVRELDRTIARQTEAVAGRFPPSTRADKLAAATLDDLRSALPADAAVVDFCYYNAFERGADRPAGGGANPPKRYAAFVATRDAVSWVDLAAASAVEPAVAAWRTAVTTGKEIPVAVPARVRELVWEPVRKAMPAAIKTVYICPDGDLCKVPFGALPGDKPGTILLEDVALATVPNAPFLLDKLWPQEATGAPRSGVLVVGGVNYDLAPPAPKSGSGGSREEPLLVPGAKLGWPALDNTAGEANGFAAAAQRKKLTAVRLAGDRATAGAVLAALPDARYAHFATHGFFADPSFRGIFQLDERDFRQSMSGERVGLVANNPLVMTGLVMAGANAPGTPGRGILTGEQLVDRDLSGLHLAVLSACETGLGDVAGGEGVYGLQRAFHYAGATNVVASLWKVPDQSTAALMSLFYRNLWDQNLTPIEALRRAQLELYKNPGKIADLAKGFRGTFDEVSATAGAVEVKAGKDGTAHPLLWAAFTLSGPGR
jgi:CHAT domain-containing protein/tetratricopeptide (TPR) repeat protein